MKKYLAWLTIFFMCHLQFAVVHAQSAEIDARCKSLQEDTFATARDSIERRIPYDDPATALSRISCIDAILNTRLTLGLFFDLSQIIDKLIQKACDRILSSWNPIANRINSEIGGQVRFPYGVGGANSGFKSGSAGFSGTSFSENIPMYLGARQSPSRPSASPPNTTSSEPPSLWQRFRGWITS